MNKKPNPTLETNHRPASPLNAGRKFARAFCDPALVSGGGRSAFRSTTQKPTRPDRTSPLSSDRMNRIYRMVPIMGSDRMDPVHPAILSKTPGLSSRREPCTRTGLRVRSLLRYPCVPSIQTVRRAGIPSQALDVPREPEEVVRRGSLRRVWGTGSGVSGVVAHGYFW